MTDHPATRMRDAGRSWTEISDHLGIPVVEAKERVQADKAARREALSKSQVAEDRNGLRDLCGEHGCNHERKKHSDFAGECSECGPNRQMFSWYDKNGISRLTDEPPTEDEVGGYGVYAEWGGCSEFVEPKSLRAALPWYRQPEPEPVDDVSKLSSYVSRQARQLGVVRKMGAGWYRRGDTPAVQQPTLETLTRRARKKLKQGKKLKRHYDAPKRNDWL